MRVCYISNPNSSHTRRWVGWFARHGYEVCLLADVPQQAPWPEVKVIDLSKISYAPVIRFPIWTVWLRRFLHQWQPDILHAHRVNSAGWLAAASGFHPFVVTPWGSDVLIQPQRSQLARWLAGFSLGRADVITVNSDTINDQVIKLGARAGGVKRLQFGVETDIFTPSQNPDIRSMELRRQLGLAEDSPVVLSPRAIHPIYNIDIILQAIPGVCQVYPKAVFLFKEFNIEPAYKAQLDQMIQDLGVGANLRWLPPSQDRHEMADLYRMSSIVVSVPVSDGTPVSVLEAMACGKPVICSDLPTVREFITSGEDGWLVPVRQSAALVDAIIQLLAQPQLGSELGTKANRVVAERYNYELEMQRMELIYQELSGVTKKSA
jgi:L-malate glycosyltransferase